MDHPTPIPHSGTAPMPVETGKPFPGKPFPVRFPAGQIRDISAVAKALGLSKQDTIRQSVRLGLPSLLQALNPTPAVQ